MTCAPVLDRFVFGSCFQPFGCVMESGGDTTPSMTNVQKLALVLTPEASQTDRATQIDYGQSVSVSDWVSAGLSSQVQTLQPPSDSFVVSGLTGDAETWNGRYTLAEVVNDAPSWRQQNGVGRIAWFSGGGIWAVTDDPEEIGIVARSVSPRTTMPWLIVSWLDPVDDPSSISFVLPPSADPTVVVVSGAGTAEANGVYTERGTSGGKAYYNLLGAANSVTVSTVVYASGAWHIKDSSAANVETATAGVEATPWLATWATSVVTAQIQHPAVFVSGAGTAEANGIWRYSEVIEGRPKFKLLGDEAGESFIAWNAADYASPRWVLIDTAGTLRYYSADDAVFPWLATGWMTDGGAGPAPTLTPVTQGELDAGVTVAGAGTTTVNRVLVNHGNYLGKFTYGPNPITDAIAWTGALWEIDDDDARQYKITADTASPWIGTVVTDAGTPPVPTISRNNVAAEANWEAA